MREPSILIRNYLSDDRSGSEGTTASSLSVESISSESEVNITSIVLHPRASVAFCGGDDESVGMHDIHAGKYI